MKQPIDAAPITELMQLIGAEPSNSDARTWLTRALESIPPLLRSKQRARPQAERNRRLDALVTAVGALRRACLDLDLATVAALDETMMDRRGKRYRLEAVINCLREFEEVAASIKRRARPGARPKEGVDEAVKLLIAFAEKFGKWKSSAKQDGHFHQFVRGAFLRATGEDRDLSRSISRVLKSRRLQTEEKTGAG